MSLKERKTGNLLETSVLGGFGQYIFFTKFLLLMKKSGNLPEITATSFMRFSEVFRGFQRFPEVSRGFQIIHN
jgi:hypothetical protein